MKKRFLSALALLLALTLFAACGGSPASEAPSSEAPSEAASSGAASSEAASGAAVAGTINEGQLVIGLDDQFPPMGFRDDNNDLVGFDIDLAKAVCERLGLEAVPTPIDWTTKELELDGGRVDVLWNGLTITPERQEVYAFSEPYARSIGRVAVPADSEVQTLAELDGARSAQTATSNWAAQMEDLGAEIVPVQGFAEAIELVLQGRADATANDLISFQTYQEEHPEATFRLLDEELPDETTVGVIMQQGQEPLLTEVNAILEEMKQDGSLTAIYEEWVGQDITPEG